MSPVRWRVAMTRDDESGGDVPADADHRMFRPLSCPVFIQGPAPDLDRLATVARDLDQYDWIICVSARAVKPLHDTYGANWPKGPRTAAVGPATGAAMRAAGANPIISDEFNAKSLLEKLRSLETWQGRRVLITTVSGGRRELIDGLRAAGALVTEIETYSMVPRPAADIRRDWERAKPDAVIIGSAETARRLIETVGADSLRSLKAVIPIGPTTRAALAERGVVAAEPPERATFAAAVEKVVELARLSRSSG